MTNNVQTFEITAFKEADLASDGNLSYGDTFTMGSATVCITVTDNDNFLSGDSCHNENANDHSYQTATITDLDGNELGNGHQIYAEQYWEVHGSDGKTYYLIEIEQEGDGQDFFTFYGDVPAPGVELTVGNCCNVTWDWVDYKCLSAGLKWDLDEDCVYTIEAEDMELWNYDSQHNNAASEGELIKLAGHTGTAKLPFGGEAGTYNFCITYVDENDGQGFIDIFINGQFVDCISLDQDNNGDGLNHTTFSVFEIEGLVLNPGDEIKLKGRMDGHEYARIDKIEFKQVKGGDICGTVWCDDDCDGIRDAETCEFGPELVVNGGFEDNSLNNSGQIWNLSGNDLPGWVLLGQHTADLFEKTASTLGNTAGDAVVELDKGSILCQEVDVPEDGVYRLSLDFLENSHIGSSDNRIEIFINGVSFAIVDADGQGNAFFDIDLDAGVTRLDFKSLSGVHGKGPGIDDISLKKKTIIDGENGKEGVLVTLTDVDGNAILDDDGDAITTLTDAAGNYKFEGVPAGDYRVQFTNPNGTEFTFQNVGSDDTVDSDADASGLSDSFTVVDGETVENIDAGLKEIKPGSLSGRYFCDDDGDGLDNDGSGNGVGGITVELLDAAGNGTGITTTTASDGSYSFSGLAPGTYGVRFTDPTNLNDGKALTTPNVDDDVSDDIDSDAIGDAGTSQILGIEVVSEQDTPDNDAGVVPLGSIAGRLFCDTDNDDLDNNNGDEPGVGGVTVTLTNVGTGEELTTETGADGSYLFEDLAAGEYKVTFDGNDPELDGKVFVNQTPGDNDAVGGSDVDPSNGMTEVFTLGVGEDKTDVDAGVEDDDPGTGAIGDTIWLDLFGDGLFNDFEATVDGVTVQLKDSGGTVIAEQVTANGGQYLFENLDAGTYFVQIVTPVIGDTITFVNADGTTETITLEEGDIEGFELTTPNAGDDALDSDFDPSTMMTGAIELDQGEIDLTNDGGLLRCGLILGTSQADLSSPVGGYDLLIGCETDDLIRSFSGEDTLIGNDGNDFLQSDSFDDTLDGGAGNDTLFGGTENDILIGGADNDEVDGGNAFDIAVFSGVSGDSAIAVSNFFTGELLVTGTDGTDIVRNVELLRFDDIDVLVDDIVPGGTTDIVAAPAGPGGTVNIDVLANDIGVGEGSLEVAEANNGGFGTVTIEANGTVTYTAGTDFAGYDFFSYTVSNGLGFLKTVEVQVGDLPNFTAGDPGVIALADFIGDDGDIFTGTNASEIVLGGIGYDSISAVAGDDTVDGAKGDDRIIGGGGNDLLIGGEGNDVINGASGNDQAFGELGNDIIVGAQTDDIIFGGSDDDSIRGQDGSDFMVGGAGDDEFIQFRGGADIALGGAGADSFEWNEVTDNAERDLLDGESGIDSLEITLDAGTDTLAVQAEIDAYLAQAAANTPSGGTISDGSVLSDTFSFTTIELDIRNIEDVFIS